MDNSPLFTCGTTKQGSVAPFAQHACGMLALKKPSRFFQGHRHRFAVPSLTRPLGGASGANAPPFWRPSRSRLR